MLTGFWLVCFVLFVLSLIFVIPPLVRHKSYISVVGIFASLVFLSIGTYYLVGGSDLLGSINKEQGESKIVSNKTETKVAKNSDLEKQRELVLSTKKEIHRLKEHLTEFPDDDFSWFNLGKIYIGTVEYSKALEALAKAKKLMPENLDYQIHYVLAKTYLNKGKLDDESKEILGFVLNEAPNNVPSLNLYALDAYNRGDKVQAKVYWQKIVDTVPVENHNNPGIVQIKKMLEMK